MNSFLQRSLILLTILLTIFIVAGCSSDSSSSQTEADPSTYLVTYSDNEVNKIINYFKSSAVEIEEKVKNGTDQSADEIKAEIQTLKTNINKLDEELETAVTDNKITNEVKMTYDSSIETLKTDLDELDKSI